MSEHTEKNIAAIDLGTSKMSLTVARANGKDVEIVYYREIPSDGVRYSGVWNVVKAQEPLKRLIQDAEESLDIKITQAVIVMPKYPVRQETNSGKVMDRGEDTEITAEDIDCLKRFAQDSYPLPSTVKEAIYGAVAQSFSDGENFQIKEEDIVGMSSDVLEGHFKIFIGKRKELMNADALLTKVGISAIKKYFTADTTARVILSETEMDNGVALVDFGGGSTSVTIYHDGILRHYASIPFGGKSITHDIKSELQITERLAENIKMAFGACMPEKLLNMSEKVLHIMDKTTAQDKQVTVKYLSEIVTARVEEIMEAVLYEIQESGLAEHLRCGIVITGGAAQTANLGLLINEMSGYKVRIGYPRTDISDYDIDGTHEPSATTILGLVTAAIKDGVPTCAVDNDIPYQETFTTPEPVYIEPDYTETEVEYVPEAEEVNEEYTEYEAEEEETEVAAAETEIIQTTEQDQPSEKEEKWKFLKVVWGKAQTIGANINKMIDGITVEEDDTEEFGS